MRTDENVLKSNQIPLRQSSKKLQDMHIGSYVVVFFALAFILVPMYIMVITSLTPEIEADNAYFSWWPQTGVTIRAYEDVFTKKMGGISLIGSFFNTMWIYFPSTVVGVFMSGMAAYAFAKLDFKLNKPMFAILMATLTLPNCMGTMASFLIFDSINWIDTPFPLMIPRMMGTIGVVFFLRQFYMGLPDDLIGAGYLDGLDEITVFFRILLPLSMPALISQIVLQFIGAYNDYLAPLLYLQDAKMYTVQIALAFYTDPFKQDWPLRMSGAVIVMTPLIFLYLIAQKYILRGVAITTGLKG